MLGHHNVNTITDWNVINMSYKNLVSFPKIQDQKKIILFNNKIDRIPKVKNNYTELCAYNNQINFIEDLPESLRVLKLYKNFIGSFTFNLPNLIELDLSQNSLTEFSGEYPKLEFLNLSKNELINVDINTPALRKLDISNNKIETLNVVAPNLSTFCYSNNMFKEIFPIFKQFPNDLEYYKSNFQNNQVDFTGFLTVSTDFEKLEILNDNNFILNIGKKIFNHLRYNNHYTFEPANTNFEFTFKNLNLDNITFFDKKIYSDKPIIHLLQNYKYLKDGSSVISETYVYLYTIKDNTLFINLEIVPNVLENNLQVVPGKVVLQKNNLKDFYSK